MPHDVDRIKALEQQVRALEYTLVVPEKPQGAREYVCLVSKSMVKNTQKSVDLSKRLFEKSLFR